MFMPKSISRDLAALERKINSSLEFRRTRIMSGPRLLRYYDRLYQEDLTRGYRDGRPEWAVKIDLEHQPKHILKL